MNQWAMRKKIYFAQTYQSQNRKRLETLILNPMKKITTLLLALGISFAYAGDGITSKNNNCMDCEPAPAVCADCDTPQAAECLDCVPAEQAVAVLPKEQPAAPAPASRAEAREAWNQMSRQERKGAVSSIKDLMAATGMKFRDLRNNPSGIKKANGEHAVAFEVTTQLLITIVLILLILVLLAILL